MMDITINLIGVVLIVGIIWWFWLSVPISVTWAEKATNNHLIEILLEDGVYTPSRIEVPLNQEFTLRFIRNDASPCAEKVLFEHLDQSLELPLKKPADITLNLTEAGEYAFNCEMNMYRGVLLAKKHK